MSKDNENRNSGEKNSNTTAFKTLSATTKQERKKASKVIWIMLSLSFYSAGTAFISVFLIAHLKNFFIFKFSLPELQAQELFSITAAIGMSINLISNIVGGSISDDFRSRWGNRLPIILAGALFASINYICAPFLINQQNIFIMTPILYGLISLGLGCAASPQFALISELFSREERSWVGLIKAALETVGTALGIIFLDSVEQNYIALWGLTGIILLFFASLTFIFTPKRNPTYEPRNTLHELIKTPKYLLTIGGGDVWKMVLVQMVWGTATYSLSINLINFLTSTATANPGLGLNDPTAYSILILLGISGALSAVPIGIIIQLIGKVKSAILGTGILATYAFMLSSPFFWSHELIYIVTIIGGIGTMFITTVTVALPSDLVPKGKEGQFMGIYLLANGAPQPIFLLIGSQWIYAQLFFFDGILLIVGIIILFGIQYEKTLDAEYDRFYERYLIIKGFIAESIEILAEKLSNQIDLIRFR